MIINPAEVISFENKRHFGVHCTERKELLYVSICALRILYFTSTVQVLWPKAFEP